MTPHDRATTYPDQAWSGTVSLVENVPLARDTYRVRLECPELAERITPGQFVMLRLAGCDDPLLGRPLALYDVYHDPAGRPAGIDVVYLVLGKMTRRLSEYLPGQKLDLWGPLGNGFDPPSAPHLVMVAGGIGQTPFLAVTQGLLGGKPYGTSDLGSRWLSPPTWSAAAPPRKVTLLYGARNESYLAGVADFERAGAHVQISTDDGSAGVHGRVTDLLKPILASEDPSQLEVFCCGPEPMMEAVARLTETAGAACKLSLETPMACGLGICFSCVARVRTEDGSWDYARTCVEGPVFDARSIAFED